MLQIKRSFTPTALEEGLLAIRRGEAGRLWLPNNIDDGVLAGSAALIQLIASWALEYPAGTLVLHAEAPNDNEVKTFARTPFGLTALSVAKAVQTKTGQVIISKEALGFAREYIDAMYNGTIEELSNIHGRRSVNLLCLDNSEDFGLPDRLYKADGDVQGPDIFIRSLRRCIGSIIPENRRDIALQYADGVGDIAYELFKNTHDHAKINLINDKLKFSVRGVIVKYHYINMKSFSEIAGKQKAFTDYLSKWTPDKGDAVYAQFLELSVFDMGPGMAENWLRRAEGLEPDEIIRAGARRFYDAILACMQKNSTTKRTQSRGDGLYKVTEILKQTAGLMRIRSGRMSLVKAFSPHTIGEAVTDDDLRPVDVESGGIPEKLHVAAAGTSMSVLIPLNTGR